MGVHLDESDAIAVQIFQIFIFWPFLGVFVRNFGYFGGFGPKFQTKTPKKAQKIKI